MWNLSNYVGLESVSQLARIAGVQLFLSSHRDRVVSQSACKFQTFYWLKTNKFNEFTSEKLDNLHSIWFICSSNFKIYWGVPTSSCRKFNIDFANLTRPIDYGLVQNTNDSVRWVNSNIPRSVHKYFFLVEAIRLQSCTIPALGHRLNQIVESWSSRMAVYLRVEISMFIWSNSSSTSSRRYQINCSMASLSLILSCGVQRSGRTLTSWRSIEIWQ